MWASEAAQGGAAKPGGGVPAVTALGSSACNTGSYYQYHVQRRGSCTGRPAGFPRVLINWFSSMLQLRPLTVLLILLQ